MSPSINSKSRKNKSSVVPFNAASCSFSPHVKIVFVRVNYKCYTRVSFTYFHPRDSHSVPLFIHSFSIFSLSRFHSISLRIVPVYISIRAARNKNQQTNEQSIDCQRQNATVPNRTKARQSNLNGVYFYAVVNYHEATLKQNLTTTIRVAINFLIDRDDSNN